MRRASALVALACACAAPAASSAPPAVAASAAQDPRATTHHELRVTLDPAARRLEVEDTVTLSPALRARAGDSIALSLHAGLSPRGADGAPLALASSASPGGVPLERFRVRLAPGQRSFAIRYAGTLYHPVVEEGEGLRKAGASEGLVSPDGAVLDGDSGWVATVEGEGAVSFTLDARLPPGWEAVSQGARTRHDRRADGTLVRWESPEPQQEVLLVAGPLVERSRTGRFVVQTFLRADDAGLATTYLEAGERYLAMYEALLGKYAYPKFALVENFWETGYGMPSFTLLGSRVLRLPFLVTSSYPHEILHNWWGNGVFVDPAGGNWSEGLTAYLADHLIQEQRGQGIDHRRASLQRYADYVSRSADFPVRDFRSRHGEVTQAVGYDKVLLLFHMLRQRVGDERFVAGLRRFYAEWRFRRATFADLGRAMSAAAGEDLAPWLAQWIDRPGAPALRVDSVGAGAREGHPVLELGLTQTQDEAPYALDVPVAVTVEGAPEAERRTVRMTERTQRFTIDLAARPLRVDVDPELDLFRRLEPGELPPALSGAFGAPRAVLVLPSSAPPALRSAYAALAERLRGDGGEVVSDAQMDRVPPGKAVWVLGWENRLRDAVARGVAAHGASLTADALRAGDTVLARGDRTAVVAVRSPADPAQVLAFVGAASAGALPGLARKLPHYGRYGLLGFEGEEPTNVVKQSWPVLASPLAAAVQPGAPLPARGALPPRKPLAP